MFVVVGQSVRRGEPVAQLDDQLQRAMLQIAATDAKAVGAIETATAETALHRMRIEKLNKLTSGGYARPEELLRAKHDLAVAQGRLKQAEESKMISEAELIRYQVQLQRRTITAPVDGVISQIQRDPGEYMSPTDPYVVQMIQDDPLIAVFNLTSLGTIKPQSRIRVRIGPSEIPREGVVDSIAPMFKADAGTIEVRIRIANSNRELRAGERCWLDPSVVRAQQATRRIAVPKTSKR